VRFYSRDATEHTDRLPDVRHAFADVPTRRRLIEPAVIGSSRESTWSSWHAYFGTVPGQLGERLTYWHFHGLAPRPLALSWQRNWFTACRRGFSERAQRLL
jgi:hypothetical protein